MAKYFNCQTITVQVYDIEPGDRRTIPKTHMSIPLVDAHSNLHVEIGRCITLYT